MKPQDEGLRGREDYLNTKGWNWEVRNPKPRTPKVFYYKHMQMLRPTITVYGGNEE